MQYWSKELWVVNIRTSWSRNTQYLDSIFTSLHRMQTRSSDEKDVCPSVRLSVKRVDCDKTEERSVQIFIPYERAFSLVFWEEVLGHRLS